MISKVYNIGMAVFYHVEVYKMDLYEPENCVGTYTHVNDSDQLVM